jgi:hypothetical protein
MMAACRLYRLDASAQEGVDRRLGRVDEHRLGLRPQLAADTGIRQQLSRLGEFILGDEDAPWQHAERSFHDTHVLVDDQMFDAGILQKGLDEGNHDHVIGADELFHVPSGAVADDDASPQR